MAGIKISALPAVPFSAFTDVGPFVQAGTTYKTSLLQIGTLFGFDSTSHLLAMSAGGTNANLSAAIGAIPYSTATAFALLAAGTAGQLLASGGAGAPTWTTSTFPTGAGAAGSILISNGTNWVSSTSLWPNTVGTSGKILRSNGTSNAYTSAVFADTYPASNLLYSNGADNVVGLSTNINGLLVTSNTGVPSILAGPGTTGNILQSNAAAAPSFSTATFPSTGGAAGNILISNGTNYIASTSLWPNTVGSVGKILRSDGTTNAYTTATFPDTAGSSGNVLVSDGTNWSSSATTSITALGAQAQALDMNSHLINNVLNPVSNLDAANKQYVDTTALNGTSVYAASAATLGTVTQAGAGVGATLTNAGVQATFALDGVNPPVGTNVLIKDTAIGMTSANEGIYTVTNAGSAITNWILTRATSYDTAAEVNATGLILVQNGSTLVGTAWYNAATIVTVDTTAFNYSQFGNIVFPINVANGGTGLSSLTAYGIMAAGTTSTGNMQQLGLGNTGQVLQSNGSSALATFSTATYPSTTTINELLYSSANNVVSGLATSTTAVLTTSSGVPTWAAQLSLALGGTNANLTASNGGIFYSTATAGAILAGTATARQMLQSGASTTPAWSTTTWPATTTINRILYSSAANVINEITTANDAILTTNGSGVPALASAAWATFSPNITFTGGAGNTAPTYTTTTGRYCQIGKIVYVQVLLVGDGGTAGAGTGRINIALPVNVGASYGGGVTSFLNAIGWAFNNATAYQLLGLLSASAAIIGIFYWSSISATASFTGADQNNTNRALRIQFYYEVA